jgi:hypothetical protein
MKLEGKLVYKQKHDEGNSSCQTVDKLDENRACLQSSVLVGGEMGLLISVPGTSLSAGLALSLLVALLLRGLTCPADPAGVFAPSTPINRNSRLNVEQKNNERKPIPPVKFDKAEVKEKNRTEDKDKNGLFS